MRLDPVHARRMEQQFQEPLQEAVFHLMAGAALARLARRQRMGRLFRQRKNVSDHGLCIFIDTKDIPGHPPCIHRDIARQRTGIEILEQKFG